MCYSIIVNDVKMVDMEVISREISQYCYYRVNRQCHILFFFFSSRRRHTRCSRDWSSDVCSSDLKPESQDISYDRCGCGLGGRFGGKTGRRRDTLATDGWRAGIRRESERGEDRRSGEFTQAWIEFLTVQADAIGLCINNGMI